MTAVATLKSRLRALAARPDGDLDVGATALVLAAMERPGATMDSYLRHLERLSGAVADYALDPAGADLAHVVQTRNYVRDAEDLPLFNRLYTEYFSAPYPARTTITGCLSPALRFELECIAVTESAG